MKDVAKLVAWVYFLFVVGATFIFELGAWVTMIIAGLAVMQVMGWLKMSKVLAVIFGIMTLFWLTQMTNWLGFIDVCYAGYFTYYFWTNK